MSDDRNNESFFNAQFRTSENETTQQSNRIDSSTFSYDFEDKSDSAMAIHDMKLFISKLHSRITSMNLNQKDSNDIYKLIDGLTQKSKEFYTSLIEENSSVSPSHLLDQSADIILNQLKQQSTVFKRNKKLSENDFYVKPQEIAIGLRWERKKIRRNGRKMWVPRLIQSTFQFFSIVGTLQAIFKSKEFRDMYFQYNSSKTHNCTEGTIVDYCCGSTFKTDFFKENPYSVKIQLYCDEFELCNPLQSKVGVHKSVGVYFSLRNIPREFRSRLKNIYPVCLVNANDLKTKATDYNNVWRPVVRELQYLEEIGINVGDKCVRGTLSHISMDNLGANESLGFTSSFSANYYCRFCLLSKKECQSTTNNDKTKHRTIEDYVEQLEIVENSEKVVFAETKGVKYFCVLNDLLNFHLINNPTCDITHDHNEGSIPHLLKIFFEKCLKLKCFKDDHLNFMFQFHDYGWLNRKNIPSEINSIKRSLGQNASQSICLFRNLPFVLYRYKDVPELASIWICVQLLLQILVIVYSHEFTEPDLIRLELITTKFLEQFLECTKDQQKHLIPKLHLMLHSADIIRMVGPLVDKSTIRYEAKHQVFKRISKKTNNFRNINKTLAIKHQQLMCIEPFSISNEIKHTMEKCVDLNTLEKYKDILEETFSSLDELIEIEWLKFNGFEYRANLLIIQSGSFYVIQNIFMFDEKYYFLCSPYEILYYDAFLNSYQVKNKFNSTLVLFGLDALKYKKSYETTLIADKEFIIEEDLDIRNLCNLNTE